MTETSCRGVGRVTRGRIPEGVMRLVWVRFGGRCMICNADLIHGDTGEEAVASLHSLAAHALGDAAHIVGASDSPNSPRGQADPDIEDRESAENLVLACPTHHRQVDTRHGQELYDIDTLRRWRDKHIERIAVATAIALDDRTLPVRVLATIEGGAIEARVTDCAQAIIRAENRLPGWSDVRYDREGLEIDLRGVPDLDANNYKGAMAKIDDEVEFLRRKHDAGSITRISLFAAAKVPLLVYLGHAFDDGIATTLYQRHKISQSWIWPQQDTHPEFTSATKPLEKPGEVVLIVGITAFPDQDALPAEIKTLPRWSLLADAPGDEVIDSLAALADFEQKVREVYTRIDNSPITRVHLVAAVPGSAAVTLGRVLDRSHHAPVVVYARTPEGYVPALEVRP